MSANEQREATFAAVECLRSASEIRTRCARILQAGLEDRLEHFVVRLERLPAVLDEVAAVTLRRYPDLRIPMHSRRLHFAAEGVDRLAPLLEAWTERSERARAYIDLVTVSVLLDAGAGPTWRYVDAGTDTTLRRSEGLAVASLRAFASGLFSSDPARPHRVDSGGLRQIDEGALGSAFQADEGNPLVGLSGRVALLRALADVLEEHPKVFGPEPSRPGGLLDFLRAGYGGREVSAATLLRILLDTLSSIWPSRLRLGSLPLGDVWQHPCAGGEGLTEGFVPFHKLSQWLTYSLVEPLAEGGVHLGALDGMTGLPEYRNGGLFLDLGVVGLRDPAAAALTHRAGDALVVEWRALTVALLDRVATGLRGCLSGDLGLPQVLEGGTWAAGRQVAARLRPDAAPPLHIDSDGTVF